LALELRRPGRGAHDCATCYAIALQAPYTVEKPHLSIFRAIHCIIAKYLTMLINEPANISLLNNVLAWFIVPLIADGRFWSITLTYWTLQNLKDIGQKQ
jgi:hypothetical protein